MKKARASNIQDEQGGETRVCEMAAGAGGSQPPVIVSEGHNFILPATVLDVVPVDGMIAKESGTRSEGLHTDILELAS